MLWLAVAVVCLVWFVLTPRHDRDADVWRGPCARLRERAHFQLGMWWLRLRRRPGIIATRWLYRLRWRWYELRSHGLTLRFHFFDNVGNPVVELDVPARIFVVCTTAPFRLESALDLNVDMTRECDVAGYLVSCGTDLVLDPAPFSPPMHFLPGDTLRLTRNELRLSRAVIDSRLA